MREYIIEVNTKRLDRMFRQHFVDPDPRVEIFEKEGATEKESSDLEMGD